jgi:tetraacyldisaccharide 4'-kinase
VSRSTDNVLALMRGDLRGPGPAAARLGLWVLSLLYGLGIRVYRLLYTAGLLKRARLRPVVISVGNLTVGGTGKTTAVQRVVRTLTGAGMRCVVLSYGYRAGTRNSVGVVSDEERVLMDVGDSGDEAGLLAMSLPGTPVVIGRRRAISGAEADRLFHPDVLVCDDAFQYWRLERDVDILLVDAVEPWGYGHLLPRGLLREPRSAARRAHAVLITHADLAEPSALARLRGELGHLKAPVWTCRHAPDALAAVSGPARSLDELKGLPVLAVSSLGDPASFEETLRRLGAEVTPRRFPDHHRYTEEDVADVRFEAEKSGRAVVTTPKDAVKLKRFPACASWLVLQVTLDIDGGDTFDEWLLRSVRARCASESR